MTEPFDILIVGGGINGAGIARDAAGRGLKVILCEMGDLAGATSSWSSKMIHGGLRYLEHYEFRLVGQALAEREILWRLAPHLIEPMRLVLPHRKGLRPAWLLRMGLFLYDHLGGKQTLPGTKVLKLSEDVAGKPLKKGPFRKAFEYSDCKVDDSRLVVANARDAADRGAAIETRTRVTGAKRDGDVWTVTLRDERTKTSHVVTARTIVNAAGPWVSDVLSGTLDIDSKHRTRLVQGSHIVTRKLYEHDRAYILQNADGRVIFVIPYLNDFTLIGTTDRDYSGDPARVQATAREIDYLCAAVSENFERPVTPADVVWSFSGVRPLYDDGASDAQEATREYVFELDAGRGKPAALSVFGGKITTYRRLAEAALAKLAPYLPARPDLDRNWTAKTPLPGGDFKPEDRGELVRSLRDSYPFLTPAHLSRLLKAYGTNAGHVLGAAKSYADLGQDFGATLTEAEVQYLVAREWAETTEDIVWRRSKLGLYMTANEIAALDRWLQTSAVRSPVARDLARVM